MTSPAWVDILRDARARRRISQLELSMLLGVSQRHVSFVESGRARPSRSLLLAWMRELEAPLGQHNAALLGAGYAPAYTCATLNESPLASAVAALRLLLSTHDPFPGFVLDAHWNVIDLNDGARWLSSLLAGRVDPEGVSAAAVAGAAAAPSVNMLDALAAPRGIAHRILNLGEVGPALLNRLRREAQQLPELAPRVAAVETMLRERLGAAATSAAASVADGAGGPVLTTHFDTSLGELAFFSMLATFGTPQDITLASLRVELLFAANAATAAVLERCRHSARSRP